jgi:hypothetical protein
MTEHQIQSEYFKILAWNESKFPELKYIFAIPNGGKRSIGVAVKMKREGVKRGVPDIFVPIPKMDNLLCIISGKWLETKTDIGKQSKEQKEYQKFLLDKGYNYALCRSVMNYSTKQKTIYKL